MKKNDSVGYFATFTAVDYIACYISGKTFVALETVGWLYYKGPNQVFNPSTILTTFFFSGNSCSSLLC